MARHKNFGGAKKAYEPISFDLHDETFNALPAIQGAVLIEFAAKAQDIENGAGAAMTAILEFFESVLTDESYERFDALIKSKDRIVDMETLGEIVAWLMEEYSGRPEEQPKA